MDKKLRRGASALIAFALLASSSGGRFQAQAPSPTITGYTLVSQKAITRTVYEYTYRATLSNPGAGLASAAATVVSSSSATVIVDNTLTFGPVAAGGTATSTDTFALRQDRLVAFNPAALSWTVTAVPANRAPIAVIGPLAQAFVGLPVSLDGSGSSDPDGTALTFAWHLLSRPAGSAATLTATTPTTTFTPDRPGAYLVQLVVSDGALTGQATAPFTTSNRPPVPSIAAIAEPVFVASPVAVDGTGSADPDGDALSFLWSITQKPAGSAASLSATTASASFVPDRPGTYEVTLTVNDGQVSVAASRSFSTANSVPVANAGPDQTLPVNGTATLNGTGSTDIDGDPLTYAWRLVTAPAGSSSGLVNPSTAGPTLAIDRPGTFVIELVVTDSHGASSAPDQVVVSTINSAPVANAGPDQTVGVGSVVAVNGAGSTDVDGDPLTYQWQIVAKPVNSAAVLSSTTAIAPTFTADVTGEYELRLTVFDGHESASDTVRITTGNTPPHANAGSDQSARVGTTVTLDGSGSSDIDGQPLTYFWSLITVPQGSTAQLSSPLAIKPTFVLDEPGVYVAQLVVNDGAASSAPDTVTITTTQNTVPVANAGDDQSFTVGQIVGLSGAASSDADGDPLTYQWSLTSRPAGSTAALVNPSSVSPTFIADQLGTYVAQLIVSDGFAQSTPDTVTITSTDNAPVANAGPDRADLPLGAAVTLDGSGSTDADAQPLTYQWSLLSRPASSQAVLTGASSVSPSVTPDVPGDYVVQLIVNDGFLSSDPDTAVLTAVGAAANHKPIAEAGDNQSADAPGTTVRLDGRGSSDPDGDPLTYRWRFVSSPAGSAAVLSNPASSQPTFVVDLPGLYNLELIVNDGHEDSDPDQVVVNGNAPPVAEAGATQVVVEGAVVQLDGTGSFDPDPEFPGSCPATAEFPKELRWQWIFNTRPAGSAAVLSSATVPNPTFVADKAGVYIVQLIVNDCIVNGESDLVQIRTFNTVPVASAGPDQLNVAEGAIVTLDGTASADADADPLTFSWVLTTTPITSSAVLFNPNSSTPTFELDSAGVYVATLIVNDGIESSAADSVTISTPNQAPTANAGTDRTAVINQTVTANGSGSDPDGNQLSFSWTLLNRPAGSVATLSGETTASPSLTPDVAGQYVLRLVVNDGFVNSAPDEMVINVTEGAIGMLLTPSGPVGVGRSATLRLTLPTPAAGAINIALASDAPGTMSVSTNSVPVPAGQTTAFATITGVSAGGTFIRAGAPGYAEGSLSVSVTSSYLTTPTTLNALVTLNTTVPVSLSQAAPAGGLVVNLVSDNPAALEVLTPTITIPAGETLGNAQVRGLAGATVLLTASSANGSFAASTSQVTVTGEMSIVQSALTITSGFAGTIDVQVLASGTPIAGPAGGLSFNLSSSNPACVSVPANGTVPPGSLKAVVPISYGGTATRPCAAIVSASNPGFASDTVSVTVNNDPGITVFSSPQGHGFPYSVGAALQSRTFLFRLGLSNHNGRDVQVCSDNGAILKVSANATTAGDTCRTITIADGLSDGTFVVQGVEGATGSTTVTVTAMGFAPVVSGAINVVTPMVAFGGPNFGTPGIPATMTSLQADAVFQISIGVPNPGGTALAESQTARGGGAGVDVTVTSSVATVATLKTQAGSGASRTVHLNPNEFNSATTLTNPTGLAVDPLNPGTTVLTVGATGFTSGPSHTLTVTATGITLFSSPQGHGFPYSVGTGLQSRTFLFRLGGANHGGRDVQVCSDNPAILKVSVNATTAGDTCRTITIADGVTDGTYVVQGVEGTTGSTTVTATATGFTPAISGVINVVTPMVAFGGPNFGTPGIPATMASLQADAMFQISIGVPNAGGTALAESQTARGGGPGVDVTVTSSVATVATLKTQAGSGASRTVHLNPNEFNSATTLTNPTGLAVDPLNPGTTVLTVGATGFASGPSHTLTVTATGITLFSSPQGHGFPYSVGTGLQSRTFLFRLGGANHGGRDVQVCSDNPAILKVSVNATTAGDTCRTITIADGLTDGTYVVQGVEGATGSTTVTVTAMGFTSAVSGVINVVTPMVAFGGPNFGTPGIPATMTSLQADAVFQISIGVPNAGGTALAESQTPRGGGAGVDVTVMSSVATVATLKTQAGSGASRTVHLNPNEFTTATTLTNPTGLAVDPLNPGTTVLTVGATGFASGPSHTLTVTATGITLFSSPQGHGFPYSVGTGLQSRTFLFRLGGANHGGRDVQVCSDNPAILKVSVNATTAGDTCRTITIADGLTDGTYVVQGVEGATGSTTVTVTATGFTPAISGVINVVTPMVAFGGPNFGTPGIPATMTSLQADAMFQISIGVPNAGGTALAESQTARGGGPGVDVTVTSSVATVATLKTQAGSGASRTVHLNPNEFTTATTLTNPTGLAIDPLNPGTTVLTVGATGYTSGPTHTVTVTATGITVLSSQFGAGFPYTVGAGLQSRLFLLRLNGNQHPALSVQVCSSNPTLLSVAATPTTVGTACATVDVPAGLTDGTFVVQGLSVGTTTLELTAPGFEVSTSGQVVVVQPSFQLQNVPSSIAATGATAAFQVVVGYSNFPHAQLAEAQALSPGSSPLAVTVTNSNAVAAQLVTASGGAQLWTVSILPGQSSTSNAVSTGGIAFDPLSGACSPTGCSTFVDADIPGFTKTTAANVVVQITP